MALVQITNGVKLIPAAEETIIDLIKIHKKTVFTQLNFSAKDGENIQVVFDNAQKRHVFFKILSEILDLDSGHLKIEGKSLYVNSSFCKPIQDAPFLKTVLFYANLYEIPRAKTNILVHQFASEYPKLVSTKIKLIPAEIIRKMVLRLKIEIIASYNPDIIFIDEIEQCFASAGFKNIIEKIFTNIKIIIYSGKNTPIQGKRSKTISIR